jgi:tetratricopeptide (TPR) repeat protein
VGKSLYESGRFAEAAVEWEQAYTLSQKAPILYNLYIAYRDASDLPNAIGALRRYLGTDEADAATRVNLQARLRAMEESNSRAASQQQAASPADAPVSSSPSPAPATATESTSDALAPSADYVQPETHSAPVLSYVLLTAGGALIIAGVVLGVVTSGKISDIKDACPNGTCPASYDLDGNRRDARTWRTVTVALAGAGVITASIGAVLLLTGGSRVEAASSLDPPVALACGPGGCAGSLRGRF